MPTRVRPSIVPDHRQGFARWRALVFVAAATVSFIVISLGMTAYLGFSHKEYVDTETVPISAAERFGRFKLPPSAADVRAQSRGTPLSGELMLTFKIPRADLDAFLATTELSDGLRPDRAVERQIASLTDKHWWWSPLRPTNDSRTFLAARSTPDHFLQLLLIDTTRPDTLTLYLHASSR